jgi:UDP-glucose 4-epimerase
LTYETVLVTGGAGFIGSQLVEGLLARDWPVRVLDDFSTGKIENLDFARQHKGFELVNGRILDRTILSKALRGIKVVFHEAAIVSELRSLEDPVSVNHVNVDGTLRLLLAAKQSGVEKFVLASSCGVYGNADHFPTREDSQLAPRTPYAASKAAAEQYCMAFHRAFDMKVVCLRYANVYGPRRSLGPYSGVMVKFAERLRKDQPPIILGDGQQTRDFVYSTDVAEATIRAAEIDEAAGKVLNIGTGITTTILGLARLMEKITGKGALGVEWDEARLGAIRFSQPDVSLATKLLGFECKVSLHEGLRKFIEWLDGSHR